MWLTTRTQIVLSNSQSPFPFTVSENVTNYSVTSCVLNIRNIWKYPQGKNWNETISEVDRLVYVNHMQPVLYYTHSFSALVKFGRPCKAPHRALFGEIGRTEFHTHRHSWHYFVLWSHKTFSNVNFLPEQCAVLRTLCLYLFSFPDSLFHLRIFAILSLSRCCSRVTSDRFAFSVW
jgi:hypothetical protein